jgi:hypothetical protein
MLRGKGKQVTFLRELFVPLLRAAFFLYLPTRVSISRSHRGHVCGAAQSQPRKTRDALGPWKIHISLLGHVMQLNRHQPARHYARFFVPADWIFAPCARTRQAIIPATAAQEPQLHYRAIFFVLACDAVFALGNQRTPLSWARAMLMTQIGVLAIGRLRILCVLAPRKTHRAEKCQSLCE